MNGSPRPIVTPCVQVCAVDGASGLCVGCHRTLAEIATWGRLDDARRTAIMAELPGRLPRVSPERRALFGL